PVLECAPRPPRSHAARRRRDRKSLEILFSKIFFSEKETEMTRTSTLVEPGTVKVERLLPGPVERVWAYIVESEKRAKWFAGGEFELRVGGKARLHFDHASLSSDKVPPEKYKNKGAGTPDRDGVITRFEPMRLLAHTMTMGGDTEVTYQLEARGKDVLLTIVHRRLPTRELSIGVM